MRFSCQNNNNNNNKSSFLLNLVLELLMQGSNIECEEGVGAFFLDFDEGWSSPTWHQLLIWTT